MNKRKREELRNVRKRGEKVLGEGNYYIGSDSDNLEDEVKEVYIDK